MLDKYLKKQFGNLLRGAEMILDGERLFSSANKKYDIDMAHQLTWMNPVYFLSISTSCWSALFLMLASGSVPIAMR